MNANNFSEFQFPSCAEQSHPYPRRRYLWPISHPWQKGRWYPHSSEPRGHGGGVPLQDMWEVSSAGKTGSRFPGNGLGRVNWCTYIPPNGSHDLLYFLSTGWPDAKIIVQDPDFNNILIKTLLYKVNINWWFSFVKTWVYFNQQSVLPYIYGWESLPLTMYRWVGK